QDHVRVYGAEAWIRYSGLRTFATEFTLIPDPGGAPDLALRANSLGSFMWASAVSAFNRRIPLRRCRVCTTWLELGRKDQLYCSNQCRVAHHVASKSKEG